MLESLSKLNALCQYDDPSRSVVHVCHIGVQLSEPNAPIHNQCKGDEINCDKPKSNEKMSIQNAKRCIIEYGAVVWAGAAVTHLRRLERLQHRFLMWLNSKTRAASPHLSYESLLKRFDCVSIRSRLARSDVMFMRSVFSGRLDCPDLVAMFSLSAPSRRSRRPELFHVPRGRVDSVRRGFLVRLPQLVNSLTHSYPQTDLFLPSDNLVSVITMFARGRGTYLS